MARVLHAAMSVDVEEAVPFDLAQGRNVRVTLDAWLQRVVMRAEPAGHFRDSCLAVERREEGMHQTCLALARQFRRLGGSQPRRLLCLARISDGGGQRRSSGGLEVVRHHVHAAIGESAPGRQ
ncbi:hypothetical protein D9M68_596110 [compost metagenome]